MLGSEPAIFTVTTQDGRVIRLFVADVLAFADFIRGKGKGGAPPCR